MCYAFRFLKPLEEKELTKMIEKNDPKAIEYRDGMFKAVPKADKPREMSSFELYCRYGKA